MFANIDWARIFLPDTPILEIIVRGSIMYLALFWMLRGVLKRVGSSINFADLLMVVLIADAAQNGMADDYTSIGDGIVLVGTIVFWNYALDWLGYHFPRFQRFVRPPALPLVENGDLLRRNMRRELLTRDELMSQLREQGVNDLAQVKIAQMEGDGRISVITYDNQAQSVREQQLG
jgi:uncharacterized membrane protein YcaP (DUF421 family)